MAGSVGVSADQRALLAVRDLLKEAENGRRLQRVLNVQLKDAAQPIVQDVKAAILAMPSKAAHQESMRSAIAAATTVKTSYSGRSTGVAIGVGRNMPRGFRMAGKRFNARSFRHPVFGTSMWVDQVGRVGWFDSHTMDHDAEAREKVVAAINEWATMFNVKLP